MSKTKPYEGMSIDDICYRIRSRAREIDYAIKMQSKVDRGLQSFIAVNVYGYNPAKGDTEGKKIFAQSAKRIKDAMTDEADILHLIVTASVSSREPFDRIRSIAELDMKHLVRALPVWNGFAESVRGFAEIGLGRMIGETGNLDNYATVSRVWKRLGLAVMGDHRQGNPGKGASAEDWILEGYSPRRRSIVYVIGDSLFKAQGIGKNKSDTGAWKPNGPYGDVYARRRARTAETHPDWTPAHAMNDATRVMTKHLIADLWSAWRALETMETSTSLPAPLSA